MRGRWVGENGRGCARAIHRILAKMAKMGVILPQLWLANERPDILKYNHFRRYILLQACSEIPFSEVGKVEAVLHEHQLEVVN